MMSKTRGIKGYVYFVFDFTMEMWITQSITILIEVEIFIDKVKY